MSSSAGTKPKQKKAKTKLDRLLLIKKNIMDSLSMLTRHDRSPAQVERNNTVPKGHNRARHRNMKANDAREDRPSSRELRDPPAGPTYSSHLRTDQIRQPPSQQLCMSAANTSALAGSQCTMQDIYQTWPHDVYFDRPFQDQYSYQPPCSSARPTLQRYGINQMCDLSEYPERPPPRQTRPHKDQRECYTSGMHSVNPSVRHQQIQTEFSPHDEEENTGVNADLVRYLNQFNDKLAFNLHAPAHLRECAVLLPYYSGCGEGFCYDTHQRYPDHFTNRRVMRPPKEHVAMNGHGCCANYQCNSGHCHTAYNDSFGMYGNQRSKHMAGFHPPPPTQHLLAPPRAENREPSDDNESIFSSETDSDFVFYPCSSFSQNAHFMTFVDSRNTSFLSPPSDMPENINPDFSWRSEFYGSSLDDVTLQFYLDEDALSDDVFVDEPMPSYASHAPPVNHENISGKLHGQDMCIDCLDPLDAWPKGSYGDNCYAYRYADIDEILDDFKLSPHQSTKSEFSQSDGSKAHHTSMSPSDDPVTNDAESKHDSDDTQLELTHEFANVFDSLRRNSTQSKARKMWRQRRAKTKKNTTTKDSKTTSETQHRQTSSMCQPIVFTFDNVTITNKTTPPTSPLKPLRGILKNKDCKSPVRPEQESPSALSDHTRPQYAHENFRKPQSPYSPGYGVVTMSQPCSPTVYATVQSRASPGINICSTDARKCQVFVHNTVICNSPNSISCPSRKKPNNAKMSTVKASKRHSDPLKLPTITSDGTLLNPQNQSPVTKTPNNAPKSRSLPTSPQNITPSSSFSAASNSHMSSNSSSSSSKIFGDSQKRSPKSPQNLFAPTTGLQDSPRCLSAPPRLSKYIKRDLPPIPTSSLNSPNRLSDLPRVPPNSPKDPATTRSPKYLFPSPTEPKDPSPRHSPKPHIMPLPTSPNQKSLNCRTSPKRFPASPTDLDDIPEDISIPFISCTISPICDVSSANELNVKASASYDSFPSKDQDSSIPVCSPIPFTDSPRNTISWSTESPVSKVADPLSLNRHNRVHAPPKFPTSSRQDQFFQPQDLTASSVSLFDAPGVVTPSLKGIINALSSEERIECADHASPENRDPGRSKAPTTPSQDQPFQLQDLTASSTSLLDAPWGVSPSQKGAVTTPSSEETSSSLLEIPCGVSLSLTCTVTDLSSGGRTGSASFMSESILHEINHTSVKSSADSSKHHLRVDHNEQDYHVKVDSSGQDIRDGGEIKNVDDGRGRAQDGNATVNEGWNEKHDKGRASGRNAKRSAAEVDDMVSREWESSNIGEAIECKDVYLGRATESYDSERATDKKDSGSGRTTEGYDSGGATESTGNDFEEAASSERTDLQDQYHFILSPTDDGSGEIIAVRKSSVEDQKWAHSLQRRYKRLAKRESGRALNHPPGLKVSECCSLSTNQPTDASSATL